MAEIRTQIAVFMDNIPGMLANLCDVLLQGNINILALTVSDTVDHAVVRMIVDKPADAIHRLGEAGMLAVEKEVVIVGVANRPGALREVADTLAKAGINIEYSYGTAPEKAETGVLVLRTSDPGKTVAVLKD